MYLWIRLDDIEMGLCAYFVLSEHTYSKTRISRCRGKGKEDNAEERFIEGCTIPR